MTGLLAGAVRLAAVNPQGPNTDKVSPGLAGFVTMFLLAVATVVLVRSMVKHLHKVRYGPGPDGAPGAAGAPGLPASSAGTPAGPPAGTPPAPSGAATSVAPTSGPTHPEHPAS